MADIIFIYADTDGARVREICAALGKAGLVCDPDRTVPAGETYSSYMAARLAAAKAVVMCWSAAALAEERLSDEAAAARDAGKLAPVTLDGTLPPLGFGQIQTASLKGWPSEGARAALDTLAAALRRMRDGVEDAGVLRGRGLRARFVWSWKFWGLALLTAGAIGALYFLSPEGGAQIGESVASRIVALSAYVVATFLFTVVARALLHASRRVIGLDSRAFFSAEFLVILALSLLGGYALNAMVRVSDPTSIGGRASLLYVLWAGVTVLPAVLSFLLVVLRGVQRLTFGVAR
jgi:TIR domain